jgi:hypothetical protein
VCVTILQDPQLGPLDDFSGSESEGDEDMFAEAPPGEGVEVAAVAAGAAHVVAHAANRAAARSTDGRSL